MAKEIEHKYLVKNKEYVGMSVCSYHIRQGYLSREPERVVRVRVKGDKGYITIKGITQGSERDEFEYEIPLSDAEAILNMCVPPIIEKTRYIVPFGGFTWEVDTFEHPKKITVAEIELPTPTTNYPLPPFVDEEVTGNSSYYNSNL